MLVRTCWWIAVAAFCISIAAAADDPIAALARQETVAGERICMPVQLRAFYERRSWQPAWKDGDLAALTTALDGVYADGLTPALYHRAAIASLPPGAARDVLATDAFLLVAAHLGGGIVEPQFLLPAWCSPPRQLDLAAVLAAALDTSTLAETLRSVAPRHRGYQLLREALGALRDIERSGGWPTVGSGPLLRIGSAGARVAALRLRLAREPVRVSPVAYLRVSLDSEQFDAALDAAVRHFQSRHGIVVDGIVGPETVRELDVPAEARVRQLIVNLERWRWMPQQLGERYVIVNIAAFRLEAFERDRPVLSMKTIVGKPFTTTPFFAAQIKEVVINPPWNVPTSIAVKELWPKQRRDASYFAREHIVVLKGGRLQQTPGEWNSLGRIKFNMPNHYDVYLHDTPAKSLFDEARRTFSHGCIRLEKPRDLALLLLADQPGWDEFALDAAIDPGIERTVPLTTPEPVYVLYWTALVTPSGEIEILRDVYGRDAAVETAMTR